MAHGRAVVATRVGGVPEVVDDGVSGVLVPPEDAGALARAIAAVLPDAPRRAAMGACGRARIERDFSVPLRSEPLLAPYAERVVLRHARYDEIPAVVRTVPGHVMGLLFDLGVSSPQLDDPERGFAYAQDAPLDMRMDRTKNLTAADIVNGYPAAELARVLHVYGEERFARRIADAVVRERSRAPITSTQRLSAIVKEAIPAATRRTGGNPAKRTFQALRIEVNGELEALSQALPAAMEALAPGGRIVALAYHSLEDRIVKRAFAERTRDTTPRGLPQPLPSHRPRFRQLTRGALRPSEQEAAAPIPSPGPLVSLDQVPEDLSEDELTHLILKKLEQMN